MAKFKKRSLTTRRKPPKAHLPAYGATMRTVRRVAQEEALERLEAFSEAHRDRFVKRVQDQDFKAFTMYPLSEWYLARKIAAGADERTMIATGTYLDSIRVFRTLKPQKAGALFRVGHDERKLAVDMHGKTTAYPLWKVARAQEYGSESTNLPPRPHWGPYLRGTLRPAAKRERKAIRISTLRRLRKELGTDAKVTL